MTANGSTTDGRPKTAPFEVAIIGSGIVGLCAAQGLHKRNIPVTVYEQAQKLQEIGVGIGFTPTSVECLGGLDPRLLEEFDKFAQGSCEIRWVDGTTDEDLRLRPLDKLSDMVVSQGELLMKLCQRARFVAMMLELLPPTCVKLGNRLVRLEQSDTGRVTMFFANGQTAEADVVIGCDGVKSFVRRAVVGEDDPSAVAHFANESVYRCLLPMAKVEPAIGPYVRDVYCWTGLGANLITYPVADYQFLNVAAFVRQKEWPGGNSLTIEGSSKKDLIDAYAGFGPVARSLVETFPDELNRWAMFDTMDHPLRSYAYGLIALMGDAAHASTPHHGAGAGMGVEDALAMAAVLERAAEVLNAQGDNAVKPAVLTEALKAYDGARRERSQWLVASSRRQGAMNKSEIPEIGRDLAKLKADTQARLAVLGDNPWKRMVDGVVADFEQRLRGAEAGHKLWGEG